MQIVHPPAMRLHQALRAGDLQGALDLLESGADPNAIEEGRSAFLEYCAQSHRFPPTVFERALGMFMAAGADPFLPEGEGFTPVHSLLARVPDRFDDWLPLVLRSHADIERWFAPSASSARGPVKSIQEYAGYAFMQRFEHKLPALRARMEAELLQKGARPARAAVPRPRI